jgi:hypothetical protein
LASHFDTDVNPHRFNACRYPDLTSHFDADPDPTQSFINAGKSEFFQICLEQCQVTFFYLSRQCHKCHNFHILDSIFWKKDALTLHLVEMGYGSGSGPGLQS